MMNEINDIVIISIYDGGWNFHVMVDGIVYFPRHYSEKNIANVLYAVYKEFGSESGEEFKRMFQDKQVIICEDGCINVL